MTDVIASSTEELRVFLKQFADTTTPWTYVDRYGVAHQCYLIRANEQTVRTSKLHDEPVLSVTMIEAMPETHEGGATEGRAQELFILDCADRVTPLDYVDRPGNKHRVYITSLEQKQRRLKKLGVELMYAVKFVDAWGGIFAQQAAGFTISLTKTVMRTTHATTKWDAFQWSFGQWE